MHSPTLNDLPVPPPGRNGWPWTEESSPLPTTMPDGGEWPRISVVTPSYNQGVFLEETIRSVLLQSYPNVEYLVMDGGSRDQSIAILEKYDPWLSGWISEKDAGQTDAINKGLASATGRILAYLNSDDIYLPGAFAAVAAHITANPGIGVVYGQCQVIDPDSNVLGMLPTHPTTAQRMIERGDYLPQPATFWTRDAMERVGLFDASLHYAMDYEYFIRLARAASLAYLPTPLAAFRRHGVSKTVSQEERHWAEALQVSERHGLTPATPWYWIRRIRHHGLRMLPPALQKRIHRRLGRVVEG